MNPFSSRLIVSLCLAAGMATATPAGAASEYDWKKVERNSALQGISVTGRVVPQDGALNIESARVPGRVLAILRREGEQVSEGSPLYRISSAECSSLEEEKRVATSKKLPELLDGIQKRENQLGLRLRGSDCDAVASHAGVLTRRSLESGASFNTGDSLATVLDTRRLTVEIDVPERDQSRVRPGQKVSLQFASNPHQVFTSSVQNVVPTIDPGTRTSKARLAPLALPKNISLDALVFGEVSIGLGESLLKVPSSAVVFFNNQQYVVSGAEHPRPVEVQILNESDLQSLVRPVQPGALKEGDRVAARGAIFLLKKLKSQ